MAAILQTTFSNEYAWNIFSYFDFIFIKSNWQKSVFVQVMAWHPTRHKPLTEPMMSQFNGTGLTESSAETWIFWEN